ncbi:SDR family NAD(P)-dependent oxidoreductase [Salinisphaera sp. P385]|uniref:SDR family NAD(P)-dependent oxidoreductase n=1 Tax=Spectribacter acetivorans TaxID=3075603 RepID=A0ABU3B9Q0_9GAMM|nr:SDR family NAD(P)-dependent oxidoreductase [Salinisphaera sp. P385]MDT0619210.1 SDR family NAD(P)-dependent oxidoreductase [Salinisphaera sp. P385]
MSRPAAVVVGVGAEQGIGAAACRRFAAEGHYVFVAGRTPAKIEQVVATIRDDGGHAEAVTTDVTVEADIIALFDRAMADTADHAPADLVVSNTGDNAIIDFRALTADQFEHYWRVGCFGGFLIGREAARRLVPLGRGTMIFTGASGSLRGKPGFAHFAAAKAGLRMVSQSMAREYGPQGIHVAHVLIDGGVDGERVRKFVPGIAEAKGDDGLLNVDAIADTYWQLHRQHPSAWTQELDLRPFKEDY